MDQEFFDDEGRVPDKPAFSGLFRPTLFKSLLYKAKTTANMGGTANPAGSVVKLDPTERLFAEQVSEEEVVLKLFLDVIQR